MDEEVTALAGMRYPPGDGCTGARHGSRPGSVRLAGQRVPIRVPRVRGAQGELSLRRYAALQGPGEVDELLMRRVLYGISCRNYEAAARAISGAILERNQSAAANGNGAHGHRPVRGFRHLPKLRRALLRKLQIDLSNRETRRAA
ncbi:MAG: hypothetical protein HYR49_06795 [Gammaproteobacteria bacterium]|nr:hypothetical protein [Gammaproteobacteria bacterium]